MTDDTREPGTGCEPLTFVYRNWAGDVSVRRVKPLAVRWGSTDWHPEPQWLLRAYDYDKGSEREFAWRDIGRDEPPRPAREPGTGWRMVPVEPLADQTDLAARRHAVSRSLAANIYRDMVSAAPHPPEPREGLTHADVNVEMLAALRRVDDMAAAMFKRARTPTDASEAQALSGIVGPVIRAASSRTPSPGGELTAAQIISDVNDIARIMLRYIGTGYEAPADHRFWDATDSRSRKAWAGAVEVYERITATEVHDALLEVTEEGEDQPPCPVCGGEDRHHGTGCLSCDCPPPAAEQPEPAGADPVACPVAWTEDNLRAYAKARGWHIHYHRTVSTPDGSWRHPFSVTVNSRDLCEMLTPPDISARLAELQKQAEHWEQVARRSTKSMSRAWAKLTESERRRDTAREHAAGLMKELEQTDAKRIEAERERDAWMRQSQSGTKLVIEHQGRSADAERRAEAAEARVRVLEADQSILVDLAISRGERVTELETRVRVLEDLLSKYSNADEAKIDHRELGESK